VKARVAKVAQSAVVGVMSLSVALSTGCGHWASARPREERLAELKKPHTEPVSDAQWKAMRDLRDGFEVKDNQGASLFDIVRYGIGVYCIAVGAGLLMTSYPLAIVEDEWLGAGFAVGGAFSILAGALFAYVFPAVRPKGVEREVLDYDLGQVPVAP
jgi:hypothetical protein